MKRDQHYSTDVLDESLARAHERRERERTELLERAFVALEGLSKTTPFQEAYLFGSLSNEGAFRRGSDVDIGFLGMKGKDVVRATAYLSRQLGFDVDVVQLEGHRFAEKITREGIKWKRRK